MFTVVRATTSKLISTKYMTTTFFLKFIPNGSININPDAAKKMAWRCAGNKPLYEARMAYVINTIYV